MNTPSIWYPFFVVDPALLFSGLATQAWYYISSRIIIALVTLLGSFALGLGQMVWRNELLVIVGYMVFALGLTL